MVNVVDQIVSMNVVYAAERVLTTLLANVIALETNQIVKKLVEVLKPWMIVMSVVDLV